MKRAAEGFTIAVVNEALHNGRWRGQYRTKDEACNAAAELARTTRRLMRYEVYNGSPVNPGSYLQATFRGEL